MVPAHQRLGHGDGPGAQVDDRLVVHLELAGRGGPTQVAVESEAGARRGVELGLVEPQPVAPFTAARRERLLGGDDQAFGVGGVDRRSGHADRGGEADVQPVDGDRGLQPTLDLFGQPAQLHVERQDGSGPVDAHHELVDADPTDADLCLVGGAVGQVAHPVGDLDEHPVADGGSEGVVDGAEAVQVDVQHTHAVWPVGLLVSVPGEQAGQLRMERASGSEAGQLVGAAHRRDLRTQRHLGRAVLEDDDGAAGDGVRRHPRPDPLGPAERDREHRSDRSPTAAQADHRRGLLGGGGPVPFVAEHPRRVEHGAVTDLGPGPTDEPAEGVVDVVDPSRVVDEGDAVGELGDGASQPLVDRIGQRDLW